MMIDPKNEAIPEAISCGGEVIRPIVIATIMPNAVAPKTIFKTKI
jgi:hypothetical protein